MLDGVLHCCLGFVLFIVGVAFLSFLVVCAVFGVCVALLLGYVVWVGFVLAVCVYVVKRVFI